jgi:quinol-cytochrome oxidoreductase complex cytochrome b subunit
VALCLLHLLRIFLWGSYRESHRRVWLVGIGLLLLTLATSFTGYLLPWDQEAYWTVTVGTSVVGTIPLIGEGLKQLLLGGEVAGAPTLVRFYALHVMVLPGCGLLLLVIHLFRLRRAGGLRRPAADAEAETVAAYPALIERQLVLALLVTLVLLALSLWVQARLGPAPDLMRPDNPPKAPWFLVGVQELASLSALWGGVVAPAVLFGLLALVPWLDGGRRARRRLVRMLVGCLLAAIVACSIIGWFFRGPDWQLQFHPGPGRAAESALTEVPR